MGLCVRNVIATFEIRAKLFKGNSSLQPYNVVML